jgi:tetratricopeptide (TPR) repeat protein
MSNAWLRTIAALLSVATFAAHEAFADPAGMALHGHSKSTKGFSFPWTSDKSAPAPTAAPVVTPGGERPTDSISATKHPIKYFKAAVAESPIGSHGKTAQRPSVTPVQQKPDAISLSTPSGPPSPEFFIYAAQVCEKQNDLPQARANLQRALTMWPGQVDVLRAAARMEDRQNNLPLAENLYQQAVTCNPGHVAALNDLGLCLARQGKLEQSVQVLEQAVQLQPAKALYRNNAATVLVEMRQDQRALAHLAAVHGAAEANYNLGQLLVERGRPTDATPYFQAAVQQNPNLQQAQEALAKLNGTKLTVTTPVTAVTPAATTPPRVAAQPAPPAAVPTTAAPAAPTQQTVATAQPQAYPTTAAPAVDAANYAPTAPPQYLPPVAARPGAVRR